MQSWMLALCSLILTSLLLGGCQQERESSKKVLPQAQVLRYTILASPTTFDSGKMQDYNTFQVLSQVQEGLFRFSEKNELEPLLAESWATSEDRKEFIIHLKKGVKFHNGKELTAEDVKWTFERNCRPEIASPTASIYLGDILGVSEMLAGKQKDLPGVQVMNRYQIKIIAKKTAPFLLDKLVLAVGFILPKGDKVSEMTQPKQVMGTGPFLFEEYHPDQLVVLKKNPNYHGGNVKLDRVEIRVIKDNDVALKKYIRGELDYFTLDVKNLVAVQKDNPLRNDVKVLDAPWVYYLAFCPDAYKPFEKHAVREAVISAIDLDQVEEKDFENIGEKATSIAPPGILGHRKVVNGIAYNPERAKHLLKTAGYSLGNGLPDLTLYVPETSKPALRAMENMAMQLKKNLNLKVSVQLFEWGAYLERQEKKKLGVSLCGWIAGYFDPSNFYNDLFTSDSEQNYLGYSNPKYDELCKKAFIAKKSSDRRKLYAEAEDILLKDAYFVPLHYSKHLYLTRRHVKGLQSNLHGYLPHATTFIEKNQ